MDLFDTSQVNALAPSQMEQMPWDQLYQMRLKARDNPQLQALIAPYEHRAYAREQVAQNALTAPLWAILPAGYQAAKALHLMPSDSMSTPASLNQLTQGMAGVWDGLRQAWKK